MNQDQEGRQMSMTKTYVMIMKNPTLNSTNIAFKLRIHQTNVLKHIKKLDFVLKLFVLVPPELNEKNSMDRIAACSSNLARHKREPFLNHLVIGDEKWIMYKNMVRKKSICLWSRNSAVFVKKLVCTRGKLCLLIVGPQGHSVL